MSAKRILFIVGDYAEDYETMVPFQALAMVGHRVDAVSPGKTAGLTVATAVHDFEGGQTYSEKRGHNFTLTADFAATKSEDYDALVIPGGRAPEHLRLSPEVIDLVRDFVAQGKPVAAVCHGAQLLAAAGVIAGHRISAYPTCRPEVELAGAEYADIPMDAAITDRTLITAPAWPAHPAWLARLLQALGTEIRLKRYQSAVMCEIYVKADPILYESRSRSLRIHSAVTTIRLENLFWDVLIKIAADSGTTTNQLITSLCDEVLEHRGEMPNVASFLRVSCIRYLTTKADQQTTSTALEKQPVGRSGRGVIRLAANANA